MHDRINKKQINIWSSTDLAISAYLALNFELVDLNRVEGNRFEFRFKKSTELEEAVNAYFNKSATVNPADYFQKIKFIKSLLYSRS